MKILYSVILILTFNTLIKAQVDSNPLPACPKSPNCFRSNLKSKNKHKKPIPIIGDFDSNFQKLEKIVLSFPNTNLESKTKESQHYQFTTKIGKFIDDVSFYFDRKNNCIHFRSASRVGWGDMGANKRRIKKIVKAWNLEISEKN